MYHPISPVKAFLTLVLPFLVAYRGYIKNNLSLSGAVLAHFMGIVMTMVNYCFLAAMLSFYVLASKATKYKLEDKKRYEKDAEQASSRTWIQVFCNGGVAVTLAVLYFLEVGCVEITVDFEKNYTASWLLISVVAALACCSGDTFASELGPVLPFSQPYLITTWQKVPKGTNGGVSLAGSIASLVGGTVVGVAFYLTLILTLSKEDLLQSPPQWPIVFVATVAGALGSIIDSLLGATFQYSGIDSSDDCVTEVPGKGVRHISGAAILNNHAVNFFSSLITSWLVSRFAYVLWWNMTVGLL